MLRVLTFVDLTVYIDNVDRKLCIMPLDRDTTLIGRHRVQCEDTESIGYQALINYECGIHESSQILRVKTLSWLHMKHDSSRLGYLSQLLKVRLVVFVHVFRVCIFFPFQLLENYTQKGR